MHTSALFQATDFRYWRIEGQGSVDARFAELFPEYHELDRVGVVSLRAADGIRYVGTTLLALTTAFYDARRARGSGFFDYPRHFALLGMGEGSGEADLAAVGPAWSNLDVWPESSWIAAPPTAAGMLRAACDLQITRLFWPDGLGPVPNALPLPGWMSKLLGSRLKAVCLYRAASPTMRIEGGPAAVSLLERSLGRLGADPGKAGALGIDEFRRVAPGEFLEQMAGCFEQEP